MKIFNKIILLAVAIFVMVGCVKEPSTTKSRAILTSVKEMSFKAQNAELQAITVYADADWTVEAPEWVTVSQTSGTASMEIAISVSDNVRGGAIDRPRKDTIFFKGYNLLSNALIIVNQEGDKFRDLTPISLAEIEAKPKESFLYANESQVLAQTSNGFVATDGTATLLVESETIPQVGDKITFYGEVCDINGMIALTDGSRVVTNSNEAVVYPAENNITATFDQFASEKLTYVTVEGLLSSNDLQVEGAVINSCVIYKPAAALEANALNGHKVVVSGYAFLSGRTVYLIPTNFVDKGIEEIIIFSDNFDWVAPFVQYDIDNQRDQGDSMADNAQYTVSSSYDIPGFIEEFTAQGYEALFPSSKTVYVMKGNYLKFSKGKNTNGIRLPAMSFSGNSEIMLSFDWGVNIGSGGPDNVQLVVEVEGNGTINGEKVSTPFSHTSGDWEWQNQVLVIKGVDDNTRITIKPTTFTGAVASGYYRWFLDNVKISAEPSTSLVLARFPFPDDTSFKAEGESSSWNLSEGWIKSEDGNSKLSVHNEDGSARSITYYYEAGEEGSDIKNHTRVLTSGMKKGGYWLFEVPVTDMPAGVYSIKYTQSSSDTGANYFLLEVSIDGQNWTAIDSKTSTETYKDGSSPREVTYTYALNKGGVNVANKGYKVEYSYPVPALPGNNTLYVKATVADDMEYRSTIAIGNKGTNRIWGPCEITFTE